MVLVVTHIDCVGSEEELDLQTNFVKQVVRAKLASLERESASSNVLALRVLRGGESFRINCLTGVGVAALRQSLVHLTLSLPWYSELIPAAYLRLQQRVTDELALGKTWLGWRTFAQLGTESSLDSTNLKIATVFLHEIGTIKYFADAAIVMDKSGAWHPPLVDLDTLEDTVCLPPPCRWPSVAAGLQAQACSSNVFLKSVRVFGCRSSFRRTGLSTLSRSRAACVHQSAS